VHKVSRNQWFVFELNNTRYRRHCVLSLSSSRLHVPDKLRRELVESLIVLAAFG
jgi:hypothetical protein